MVPRTLLSWFISRLTTVFGTHMHMLMSVVQPTHITWETYIVAINIPSMQHFLFTYLYVYISH